MTNIKTRPPYVACQSSDCRGLPLSALAQWDLSLEEHARTPDGKVDMNAPPRKTIDGHIDLSGFWCRQTGVDTPAGLAAEMKREEIPLTEWGRKVYQERIDTNGKDHPGVSCLPSGIPEKNNIPDGLKVVQTPDVLVFLYESRTIYRQVFTDGRPLPKDAQPTWMGYSIGHWEGDTFIVETIGQNGKTWLDMALPGTESLKSPNAIRDPHDQSHQHRRHH